MLSAMAVNKSPAKAYGTMQALKSKPTVVIFYGILNYSTKMQREILQGKRTVYELYKKQHQLMLPGIIKCILIGRLSLVHFHF